MIFETDRLRVRKLIKDDLMPFHEMQSNPKVMRFVRKSLMSFEENTADLAQLIQKYDIPQNDFFIYAIIRKEDAAFVGTCAFVKDEDDDEIGYRFLEKYWHKGYGKEICVGMILYAKEQQIPKLIAYVSPKNMASEKIIKQTGFQFIKNTFCKDLQIPENKYQLIL